MSAVEAASTTAAPAAATSADSSSSRQRAQGSSLRQSNILIVLGLCSISLLFVATTFGEDWGTSSVRGRAGVTTECATLLRQQQAQTQALLAAQRERLTSGGGADDDDAEPSEVRAMRRRRRGGDRSATGSGDELTVKDAEVSSASRRQGKSERHRQSDGAVKAAEEGDSKVEAEAVAEVVASAKASPSAAPALPSPASRKRDYSRTYSASLVTRWFGGGHPWAVGPMTCATGCSISFSNGGSDDADMLLFHGGPTDWPDGLQVLAQAPRQGQLRAAMAAETLNFRALSESSEMAKVDTEVSFRQRSIFRDFQYPLEAIRRWDRPVEGITMESTWQDVNTVRPIPGHQRRRAADNTVTWASNHCHSLSGREEYVKELLRHIPVEIYAAPCLKNAPEEHVKLDRDAQWDLWRTYKFYLAFENDRCDDYFTEKLYLAFTRGQVPIVLGGANVAEHVPGADSYIDTRDFESPKALAEYLLRLDADHEAFDAYLAWQKRPFSSYGKAFRDAIAVALPTAQMNGRWSANPNYFGCGLCEALAGWHAAGRPKPAEPVPVFTCHPKISFTPAP